MIGMLTRTGKMPVPPSSASPRGLTQRHRLLACAAFLPVVFLACRADEKSSLGVAERFVDQHYVEINLEAAKPYCTGLAMQKLQDEQRLTQGQAIDDSTRKPSVHYRLVQKNEEDGDHATYVFEGSIDVADAGRFTRKWMITARRDAGGWKISNFEEFD